MNRRKLVAYRVCGIASVPHYLVSSDLTLSRPAIATGQESLDAGASGRTLLPRIHRMFGSAACCPEDCAAARAERRSRRAQGLRKHAGRPRSRGLDEGFPSQQAMQSQSGRRCPSICELATGASHDAWSVTIAPLETLGSGDKRERRTDSIQQT